MSLSINKNSFIKNDLFDKDVSSPKEIKLLSEWIFGLIKSVENPKHSSLFIRRVGNEQTNYQVLTPAKANLKSYFHGFGGHSYTVAIESNFLLIIWVDSIDKSLWFQKFAFLTIDKLRIGKYVEEVSSPKKLLILENAEFGDGVIDLKRRKWIGFCEIEDRDYIIYVDLELENQKLNIFKELNHFGGYISVNQAFSKMAWLEWHSDFMPWEENHLYSCSLNEELILTNQSIISESLYESNKQFSCFQPIWYSDNQLIFSQDYNGWSNLTKVKLDNQNSIVSIKNYSHEEIEIFTPHWALNISCIGFVDDLIIYIGCKNGIWYLFKMDLQGRISVLEQPYSVLENLYVSGNNIIFVGSNYNSKKQLVEFNLIKGESLLLKKQKVIQSSKQPISLWFKGFNGKDTQGWYYPIVQDLDEPLALIIRVHGGPTMLADTSFNEEIQYLVNKGFAVFDLNYGGSSGFGRSYRERLNFKWGLSDVQDCIKAAKFLIAQGKARLGKIFVLGSSAGGFTALSCACSSDCFAGFVCKYPVTNLLDLTKKTHRFERSYLNSLVAKVHNNSSVYESRSPINNVALIKKPVIFFHGLLDNIVPVSQTINMFEEMNDSQIYSEIYLYSNEGHGFSNTDSKIDYLQKTELFLKKLINN